MSCTSFRSKEK